MGRQSGQMNCSLPAWKYRLPHKKAGRDTAIRALEYRRHWNIEGIGKYPTTGRRASHFPYLGCGVFACIHIEMPAMHIVETSTGRYA